MKFIKLLCCCVFFMAMPSLAQKVIKHTVKSGESIYLIAKKYNTTEAEIFELNPKLKGAILALKTEVKVPNKKSNKEERNKKEKKNKTEKTLELAKEKKTTEVMSEALAKQTSDLHLVTRKETLYSIAKQYGITMERICELNPQLKTTNLRAGITLKLPMNEGVSPETSEAAQNEASDIVNENSNTDVVHKVLPRETLYKIAKKYSVTVKELQRLNPEAQSGLKEGSYLIIKKGTPIAEKASIEPSKTAVVPTENSAKIDFLIAKASEHLGTHYRGGGSSDGGYDCSGLMCATFTHANITLPRSSAEQSQYGIKIDKNQAQKGDLIFFSTNGRGSINHVGMITEIIGDDIRFIHSSVGSGVIISSSNEPYYAKRFKQINRVLSN